MSAEEPWYGIRLLYRHIGRTEKSYEERILIIRAHSATEAIAQAESISEREYEDETVERLKYAMAFNVFDRDGPCLESGTEVFSLIRKSELPAELYVNRFHSTGMECSQDIDGS